VETSPATPSFSVVPCNLLYEELGGGGRHCMASLKCTVWI
jgi:hypothetical protein